MIWVNVKRIIRSGFFNFSRNAFVSLSSILVMIITLSVIGSLLFVSTTLHSWLEDIRNKVDVSVSFVTTANEDDILSLQKTLEGLPEVSSVTYTSREQVLEDFKTHHENDHSTLQALEEVATNPFGASLNVKAKDPSQYQGIAEFLQNKPVLSKDGSSIIDNIDYFRNKESIDKLSRIIAAAEKLGSVFTLVLVGISILITLNTIRLAIYISREEIAVMRLVGASAMYVRGPFVVVGMIYGAVSGILTLMLFYPVTYWVAKYSSIIGINLFDYYTHNFAQIFGIIMLSGIAIGAISSFLAVRKYLKI